MLLVDNKKEVMAMREKFLNKRNLIILLVAITIIIGIVVCISIINNNNKISLIEDISYDNDIISKQEKVDEQIKKYIDDDSYTIDNPIVLQNPYTISPLTALIIFQTKSNVSYDIYINGIKFTTTENSKKHSIPIYGLVENKNNIVKLVGQDNTSKEIEIKTGNYSSGIVIDKSSYSDGTDFYFLTSPTGTGHLAINNKGEVVWVLTSVGAQDLEFLSNGHILISNDSPSYGESFSGFYEIDYLGKIYKTYSLKNNYHHEVNELSNGNLLVAGENPDSKVNNSYIYIIDRESGNEIKSIDLYEVFKKIDNKFADSLIGTDIIANSLDFNEKTNELIVSLRGLNSVMSINFDDYGIKWILGNKDTWSEKFEKYILKSLDNSRLPMGQHTAFISKQGYLGLLNNDYDKSKDRFLIAHEDNYSSATYYEIDENNKTYKTVWNYIDDDHVFNYSLSSFNESYDNHKIINFGWSFPKSIYDELNVSIYDDFGSTYSRLVDLDENNNIVFRAKLPINIYRIFKHKFYNDIINNFNVEGSKIINTNPATDLEKINSISLKDKIDNAFDELYDINFENDTINIDSSFDILEDVKIVFAGDIVSYIYNYKPANQLANDKINLKIKGKYKVYLVINGKYYKTSTEVNFDNKSLKSSASENDNTNHDNNTVNDEESSDESNEEVDD